MQVVAVQIIKSAIKNKICLEQNKASKKHNHHFWKEFWQLAEGAEIVNGLDAHSVTELKIV